MKFRRGLDTKKSLNIGRYRYNIRLEGIVPNSQVAFITTKGDVIFNQSIQESYSEIFIKDEFLGEEVLLRIRKYGWKPFSCLVQLKNGMTIHAHDYQETLYIPRF